MESKRGGKHIPIDLVVGWILIVARDMLLSRIFVFAQPGGKMLRKLFSAGFLSDTFLQDSPSVNDK